MDTEQPAEFFSSWDTKRRLARGDVLEIFLIAVLLLGVIRSDALFRVVGFVLVALCWVLFLPLIANVPVIIRDEIRAFRREPSLRINARGIWLRKWSSLDTIEWSDVRSISAGTFPPSAEERDITVTLHNEEKYWKRLRSSEKLALSVSTWAGNLIQFLDTGKVAWNAASPTSFRVYHLPIAHVAAAIDPLLQAHGLPRLQDKTPL
jgi:hypothetical protein